MLLMSYKLGITMFVHTHDVDGTMVAHSHPFTSSNHSHSTTQVIAFGQLSTFTGIENASYEEIKVYSGLAVEICADKSKLDVINSSVAIESLRAPPACC